MKSLRYVVISDLHLGAANSILTCLSADKRETRPDETSEFLGHFAACLRELAGALDDGRRPTLVLNGDILELALAGTNEATMAFRDFIEALCGPGGDWPFDGKVYYLPGNHDHHMWNVAREKQYRENYLAGAGAGEYLKPEFQTTNMLFDDALNPIPCDLFDLAVKPLPCASGLSFLTVYPNFAVLDRDRGRCVAFHHGHYVEPIYSLMTTFKKMLFPRDGDPGRIWELEAENGAWIDFFWSALGRSGQVGKDLELVYDKMQSEREFEGMLGRLARSLAPMIPPKRAWSSPLWARFMGFAFKHLAGSFAVREVHRTGSVLSEDAQTGLAKYLETYLAGELARTMHRQVPQDMTFVFGHTHKPFEAIRGFKGFPSPVKLLNSGGWVVDTPKSSPLKGGAAILIDDELNVASLRMYNERDPQEPSRVCVNAAERKDNPLFLGLDSRIDPEAAIWRRLSELADQAILAHRQNLLFHISADMRG